MGVLRLWLAVSVVCTHAGPIFNYRILHGGFAVSIFYMLSGFYMAMVYERHYSGNYRSFIISRWIRFYPPYYFVMVLTAFVLTWFVVVDRAYLGPYLARRTPGLILSGAAQSWINISSFTLVGQEWGFLLRFPYQGQPFFSFFNVQNNCDAAAFQWLPQAITLGLEETFCLTLPLWLRARDLTLWLMIFLAITFRIWLLSMGSMETMARSFPPAELTYFFSGILAWRRHCACGGNYSPGYKIGLAVMALWISVSEYLGINLTLQMGAFAIMAVFLIGPLFQLTKDISWDRMLGNLSYPLYLIHFLVEWIVLRFSYRGIRLVYFVLPISTLAAFLLWLCLIRPLDRWRKKFMISS
jgi:peptidoglycan/LPS O-acetylase OafA/YrhL